MDTDLTHYYTGAGRYRVCAADLGGHGDPGLHGGTQVRSVLQCIVLYFIELYCSALYCSALYCDSLYHISTIEGWSQETSRSRQRRCW